MAKPEREKLSLAEIIKKFFLGPVRLRCVKIENKAERQVYPSGRKLIPATDEEADKLAKLLELERLPIIYGVAAFNSRVGKVYDMCFARLRSTIIEAVPGNRAKLRAEGEWLPDFALTEFPLVFEQDSRGRWSAKHPETGQYVQAFNMELAAGDNGKALVPAGTIAIRPACTRTFWIAGPPEQIKTVTNLALETLHEGINTADEFSYAEQFQLFGRYFTAFEVLGDPAQGGILDVDSFIKDAPGLVDEFERWAVFGTEGDRTKSLINLLHTDQIHQRNLGPRDLERALDIARNTRHEIVRLKDWYRKWVDHFVRDLRIRRASGLTVANRVPKPVGREPRKDFRLMNLSAGEIERMLYRKAPRTTKAVKDVKEQSTPTKTKLTKPGRVEVETRPAHEEKPSGVKVADRLDKKTRAALRARGYKEGTEEGSEQDSRKPSFRFAKCPEGHRHKVDEDFKGDLEACPSKTKKPRKGIRKTKEESV